MPSEQERDGEAMSEYLPEAYEEKLKALNKTIWEAAELKFAEKKSARAMMEFLKEEGFTVTQPVSYLDTAYVAEYGSGHPIIAILAEFDALSGLSQELDAAEKKPRPGCTTGHGCGHCLLGTAAVGAGLLLRDYLKAHPGAGTVRVYGCPAEEGGSGKTYMAREGCFDDVDAAFTWHPATQNSVATGSNQANIQAAFTFTGRAAHAAGAPQNGRSALDAVELMDVGVNYMREHMADYERVHYAILDTGGVSPNVVQPTAEVLYLIRSKTNAETKKLYDRVVNIAKGAALMTETTVSVRFDKAVSNLVRNDVLAKLMYDTMVEVGAPKRTEAEKAYYDKFQATVPEFNVIHDPGMTPVPDPTILEELISKDRYGEFIVPFMPNSITMMGSSDVGDVSYVTPTAQMYAATFPVGTSAHTWQWVAEGQSSTALKGCFYAAKVMAESARKAMEQPQLIADAKAELKKRLHGEKYVCPIPPEIMPTKYAK
ncbi:MAG: amidohydrolase [Acidaminococcus sp.]|nr:amidohydrolase [Acidaminococcus sp.]